MSDKKTPYSGITKDGRPAVYFICPEKGVEVFVTYDPKMWGTLNDKDANPKRWSIFKGPGETKDDVILRVCGSMEYYAKICAVWSGGGGGGGGHVSPPLVQREKVVPGAPSRKKPVMSEFFPTLAEAGGNALRAWQKPSPPLIEGFYPSEDAEFLAKEQEVKAWERKLTAAQENMEMNPCEFGVIAGTYHAGIKELTALRDAISAKRAEAEARRERVLRERKEVLEAKGLPVSLAEHAQLGNWGDLAEEA